MQKRPYIVASLIEKGGTGKTSTSVHVSEALAKLGHRVLIIELDPQQNATKWIAGEPAAKRTVYEVLVDPESDMEDAIGPTVIENVDIISGARTLGMPERFLSTDPQGNPRSMFHVLRQALERVPNRYDFVFLDCPPSVGVINTNAIIAADRLLISMDPSQLTYDGFAALALTLQQLIKNRLIESLPALSVLFTVWNARLRIARKVKSLVDNVSAKPYHVFDTTIRNRVVMRDLPDEKMTALMSTDDSAQEVAADYRAVAEELLAVLKPQLATV